MYVAILNNETWLFCGGRDFDDQRLFDEAVAKLVAMWGMPSKIVHGNAPGLDKMVDAWGREHAIDVSAVSADWARHGNAAGPIRNEEMLIKHKPQRVIAFPGGKGTADMVKRAKKRGADKIVVVEITR